MVSATSRPLYPRGRDPIPIVQEGGWAPGPLLTGAEKLAAVGIRFPDCPERSESLHRLSYRGPHMRPRLMLKLSGLCLHAESTDAFREILGVSESCVNVQICLCSA